MKFWYVCLLGLLTHGVSVYAAQTLPAARNQLSYTVGYSTGKAMIASGLDIATPSFERGLKDALQHQKAALSEQTMRDVMTRFQQQRVAEQQKKRTQLALKNQQQGQRFLQRNAKKAGVKILASGLQYKSLSQGQGAKPTVNDTVTVDYEGRLINNDVFDSSYQRHKAATLPLNAVIKGWQQALPLMSVGDTWELYVPASLAYGEQGAGPIGPNETLVFKIHLRAINQKSSAG
jgi:FKBP-type peptidyl-prolyl cis-trans isomerase FklB